MCVCVLWSSCQELSAASLPGHRTMNPCPVYEEQSKTLFLFFICILGKVTEQHQILTGRNRARLCYISSGDGGQNWSQVTDLTKSAIGATIREWATFAVGPGHGIQMQSGRLIIPAYAYYKPCCCWFVPIPGTVQPYAFSVYSDDLGHTWQIGEMLQKLSCECQMAEIIDQEGRSRLYCNARHTEYRREALSEDSGVNFDKPHNDRKLVEAKKSSGCQGSVVGFSAPNWALNSGGDTEASASSLLSPDMRTWLLFAHPTSKHSRIDLGVYLNRSALTSQGWEKPWIVHRGPSGYSDLAYDKDKDQFSCLMECGIKSETEEIAFMSFTLYDIMQAASQHQEKTC
ncbi:sialidase-3-like isoform X2 [Genypterus blacodes]|uniref:sialidase-3-like isoform X2 n=1 Tax=Genypterus blacodes TaxID=154954 RepID=UPI003F767586